MAEAAPDIAATESNVVSMTDQEKRAAIRERIAAGEAELAARQDRSFGERAAEMRDDAVEFAKKHPAAVVAGGVVLGLAVAALFPRNRRLAADAADRTGEAAAGLGGLLALYGQRAMNFASDIGHAGAEQVEDFGDALGDRSRRLRRNAGYYANATGDSLYRGKRDLVKGSSRMARRSRSRLFG